MCKEDYSFVGMELGFFCLQMDIQQCCLSALPRFSDGEDGKFTVSYSLSPLSTALPSSDMAQPYTLLQSVTDIKVERTMSPCHKSTRLVGEVRVCLCWLCKAGLYRLLRAD